MNQPTTFLPFVKPIIVILCLSFFIVSFSCNEVENKGDNQVNPDSMSIHTAINKEFHILKLKKEDLIVLFNNSNVVKLIFQFVDSGTNKPFGLVVYGASSEDAILTEAKALESLGERKDFDRLYILSNQELSRKENRSILGLSGTGRIDPAQFKDYVLTPDIDQDHIYYSVKQLGTTQFAAENTNPCPPASPCRNCD